MIVTIYSLQDPITNEIKYIGRTKNDLKSRLRGHLAKAKANTFKTKKDNWILKLYNKDLRPIINPILYIEGWSESYKKEQEVIKQYLDDGYKLVNLHDKGEGHLRNITSEQKLKISKKIKQLHKDGLYDFRGLHLFIYDLEGNFITECNSVRKTAEWLNVSLKHLEVSLKRKSKRIHTYQVRRFKQNKIETYFNIKPMPTINSVNCLETPEEDNQQPSSCGDTEKGSTTSSASRVDNNTTTKAGHQYHDLTKLGLQTNFISNTY